MSDIAVEGARGTPWPVTWLTWPVLFAINIWTVVHAIRFEWNLGVTLGVLIGGSAVALIVLEFLYPIEIAGE